MLSESHVVHFTQLGIITVPCPCRLTIQVGRESHLCWPSREWVRRTDSVSCLAHRVRFHMTKSVIVSLTNCYEAHQPLSKGVRRPSPWRLASCGTRMSPRCTKQSLLQQFRHLHSGGLGGAAACVPSHLRENASTACRFFIRQ